MADKEEKWWWTKSRKEEYAKEQAQIEQERIDQENEAEERRKTLLEREHIQKEQEEKRQEEIKQMQARGEEELKTTYKNVPSYASYTADYNISVKAKEDAKTDKLRKEVYPIIYGDATGELSGEKLKFALEEFSKSKVGPDPLAAFEVMTKIMINAKFDKEYEMATETYNEARKYSFRQSCSIFDVPNEPTIMAFKEKLDNINETLKQIKTMGYDVDLLTYSYQEAKYQMERTRDYDIQCHYSNNNIGRLDGLINLYINCTEKYFKRYLTNLSVPNYDNSQTGRYESDKIFCYSDKEEKYIVNYDMIKKEYRPLVRKAFEAYTAYYDSAKYLYNHANMEADAKIVAKSISKDLDKYIADAQNYASKIEAQVKADGHVIKPVVTKQKKDLLSVSKKQFESFKEQLTDEEKARPETAKLLLFAELFLTMDEKLSSDNKVLQKLYEDTPDYNHQEEKTESRGSSGMSREEHDHLYDIYHKLGGSGGVPYDRSKATWLIESKLGLTH